MKKFYIHKGDQQQGPFSIEELKELKITRDTMIWFEGVDNWKKAQEIDELKEIFKSIPPPLQKSSPVIPPPLIDKTDKEENFHKLETDKSVAKPKKKMTVLIVIISLILLSGIGTFIYINQQAKQTEIVRQLQEQSTKLQEQNAKIQEQERIEAVRKAEAESQQKAVSAAQTAQKLASLRNQYDEAVTTLRAAKIQLDEAQKFRIGRTPTEKQQEIQKDLNVIRSWENEVERLKNEIGKY